MSVRGQSCFCCIRMLRFVCVCVGYASESQHTQNYCVSYGFFCRSLFGYARDLSLSLSLLPAKASEKKSWLENFNVF